MIMEKTEVLNIVEQVLNDKLDVNEGIHRLKSIPTDNNRMKCAVRLLKTYAANDWFDLCGHLRQFIILGGYSVKIENSRLLSFINDYLNEFGLLMIRVEDGIKISANSVILPNTSLATLYEYKKMCREEPAIGDGRLYKYMKYPSYRSFAQKILLNKISNMEAGETLLACLPTGAGKSLSWQLPGISNEYPGVIIVIVPTVALAINHEESSKRMFEALDSPMLPQAYYADCGEQKKKEIQREILAGRLPILYISPEALMQERFKKMILEAAKNNRISMLVVDEAHLIVDWGNRFRPEFQLIPSFRNSINEQCGGIKTVLLSATFTEEDTNTLRNIFKDNHKFTEFRADALRPEISYKLATFQTQTQKIQALKKLVLQVPKPAIVYAALVQQAENLFEAVKETGLKRVRLFTGKTGARERREIMQQWDSDDIDIIVATSAFGMGVDKSDIRTIIHTFIPENISRFYQESGRAGRDGYSAVDFCLIEPQGDTTSAQNLVKSSVARVQLIVERWESLKNNATLEDGNCMWVDMHTTPKYLQTEITGEQNADWNKGIVLFLYRNHMIDILDMKLNGNGDYLIKIKLLKQKELENRMYMEQALEPLREQEREKINLNLKNSFELFKMRFCFGSMFAAQYPNAEELCSGCPYCEKKKQAPYYNSSEIKIIESGNNGFNHWRNVNDIIRYSKESLILCDDYKTDYSVLVEYLVKLGIFNIVIPNIQQEELLHVYKMLMSFANVQSFVLLDKKEFMMHRISNLISGPTAIVMDDDQFNAKVFKFAELYEKKEGNNILFISKREVVDTRYNKEIINTEKYTFGKLENLIGER